MAFMNQMKKAKIALALKPILKKYRIKGTLSVRNHSSIVLTLKGGAIDFIGNSNRVCGASHYQVANGFRPNTSNYCDVNPYWFQEHYDGAAKAFLTEAFAALKSADWYDESDAQIDYFRTAYYVDINIGKWSAPYQLDQQTEMAEAA
jgi:hypothetical protein